MDKSQQYEEAGILPFFYNAQGEQTFASDEVKDKLLATFEGHTPKELKSGILPTVKVSYQYQDIEIPLLDEIEGELIKWSLELEDGDRLDGTCQGAVLQLPTDLPLGYHKLNFSTSTDAGSMSLIIAPQNCYQPSALERKERLWGTFIQLYTLKSEHNWGVGDFGDLQRFIQHFAKSGGDFIGLNPIHSLFPANPDGASPYSPSSRSWMNIIYIDINTLLEFQESQEAQTWFNSKKVQQQLSRLRSVEWVDYKAVMELKLTALKIAYQQLVHLSPSHQETFRAFKKHYGESLLIQGAFDAIHDYESHQKEEQWGWQQWDSEYQDFHSDSVQKFIAEHSELVDFYCWLQWCADEQLSLCQALCDEMKMKIGLYRDLAVGVAPDGAETWADKKLYSLEASVGAPPDILGPQGQNWGLAPLNPHVLKYKAYKPFIEMVRANMRHCGSLRIDHIMGLLRLWWIQRGDSATNGAYISYPVDDLLAILALESQRHQCLVIGEDLGTVPEEIVQKLKDAAILSYKIFYFEFDYQGRSRALSEYPYQAMTTLSTHDLPTINGYWRGYDFVLGKKFNVYPNPRILEILKAGRVDNKHKILQRLSEHGITVEEGINESLQSNVTKNFNYDLQTYVANVSSGLFGLQPEDWLNMSEPVNIPGTSFEYPNWRRRLTATVDEIFADKDIQTLLNRVNQVRKSS